MAETIPNVDSRDVDLSGRRDILDRMTGYIATVSVAGDMQFANRALQEAAGAVQSGSLIKFWDMPLWRHLPEVRREIEKAITTAQLTGTARFQLSWQGSDGAPVRADFVMSGGTAGQGDATALVAEGRPVADLSDIEASLRESRMRFGTLADNMSQLAWMADASGYIFWYNKRWHDYTGTTLEDMKGWGWMKVHHPDHVDRVVAKIQKSWDTGDPWEDTFPLRAADGTYRWFLSRALPIRDDQGRVIRWFGTNTDITEFRRVEERLRTSEATFRAMFSVASVGKAQIDPATGRFVKVNEALCRMLHRNEAELLGLSNQQVTHQADRDADQAGIRALVAGEIDSHEIEKRLLTGDGKTIWTHVTANVIRAHDGSPWRLTAILQDITGRKQDDETRKLLMREVTHRAKNMLAIVQSIARQTERGPDFLERFTTRLQSLSANHDLLVKSEWRGVDLEALVRSQLEPFLGSARSRLSLSGPSMRVSAAASQTIAMALHELATNAAKYGALSVPAGQVAVMWTCDADGRFLMRWEETGGPKPTPPSQTGFGTIVIVRMVQAGLGAEVTLDYPPEGLRWAFSCPQDDVIETD